MAKSARLNKLHICGPGLSGCCSVISIWGIIMLAIVGGLLSAKSASFLEDIPLAEGGNTTNYEEELNHAFATAATNCYGAVGIYVGCLAFCLIQVYFNVRVASMKQ